jgi:hypothetical protein
MAGIRSLVQASVDLTDALEVMALATEMALIGELDIAEFLGVAAFSVHKGSGAFPVTIYRSHWVHVEIESIFAPPEKWRSPEGVLWCMTDTSGKQYRAWKVKAI